MELVARNKKDFINCFKDLDLELLEKRQDEKLLYPLNEIIFLVIAAVLSCAESWSTICDYGEAKLNLLRQYFPYKQGIPCKSTICRVMGLVDNRKFETWLLNWCNTFYKVIPEELINIDGKTIKGSRTKNTKATHILNVFANTQRIVIAQRTVDEKTNEIPELPKLIEDLNIEGATVTIDALGCQKEIAAKIIEKKADYFIGLKANQPLLYDAARYLFVEKSRDSKVFNYSSERSREHGRIEWRKCWTTTIPDWLKEECHEWSGLQSVCLIESERHIIGGKRSIEQRLYISSAILDAKKGLKNSRGHWGVENVVHHVLDVSFKEDDSRIHNAAENMSIIRKIGLNLINRYKKETHSKRSVIGIRKKSGWCNKLAGSILGYLFG